MVLFFRYYLDNVAHLHSFVRDFTSGLRCDFTVDYAVDPDGWPLTWPNLMLVDPTNLDVGFSTSTTSSDLSA